MSSDPVGRRNAGLRRISTITKGTLAGGLVLTGALSALAARSFAGTSTTATQSTTATTTQSSSSSDDNSYSSSQLQSPSYSIRSSSGSGRVSSGGS